MNKFFRIFKYIRDGTLAFRILNRFSSIKYIPKPDNGINKYMKEHYPGAAWKSWPPFTKEVYVQFAPIFERFKIHTIAYVGAHNGEKALCLNEAFPGREFYLIEPVPEVFQMLLKNTANCKNMHCIEIAAGAEEGLKDMFADEFSEASSLLPYESIALKEFPELGKWVTIKVHVRPLDDILRDYEVKNVDLLLMDVQGYEDKVLEGAKQTLKSCKVVISELSLQSLYAGSSTFDSAYQVLIHKGFRLKYLFSPVKGESQQILQIDGAFVRE